MVERISMNYLSYVWAEEASLADELAKPVKKVSVDFAQHERPVSLTLWHADGTGLTVYSEMHDIPERKEVGVLNFDRIAAPGADETVVDVSALFGDDFEVFKLILLDADTSAESGLALKANSGDELEIVPGACPYSLAIRGLLLKPHVFEPEYPLERYVRVPIAPR
jgi:hypothetical protein